VQLKYLDDVVTWFGVGIFVDLVIILPNLVTKLSKLTLNCSASDAMQHVIKTKHLHQILRNTGDRWDLEILVKSILNL